MTLNLTPSEKSLGSGNSRKHREKHTLKKVKAYYHYHQSRPEHRERIRLWQATHRSQINSKARERYRLRNPIPDSTDENIIAVI